jgi:hypothetical protein
MAEKTHRRLRITRSIFLNREHAEAGSIHDVPNALAQRLIGEGSAEPHFEEGEEMDSAPTTVNRMAVPENRDPQTKQVAPAPPKVVPKK